MLLPSSLHYVWGFWGPELPSFDFDSLINEDNTSGPSSHHLLHVFAQIMRRRSCCCYLRCCCYLCLSSGMSLLCCDHGWGCSGQFWDGWLLHFLVDYLQIQKQAFFSFFIFFCFFKRAKWNHSLPLISMFCSVMLYCICAAISFGIGGKLGGCCFQQGLSRGSAIAPAAAALFLMLAWMSCVVA